MSARNAQAINAAVDKVYDHLMRVLSVTGSSDALMISHWQDQPCGFRITITRKADGVSATRFVNETGGIVPSLI